MTRAQKIVLSVLLYLFIFVGVFYALRTFLMYEVDGRPLNELRVGIMSVGGSNERAPSLVLLLYGEQCKTFRLMHSDALTESSLVVTVTSFHERVTLGRVLFGDERASLCGVLTTTPHRWDIPLPTTWSEIPGERQITVVLGGQENIYTLVTEIGSMTLTPVRTANVKITPFTEDHSISLSLP